MFLPDFREISHQTAGQCVFFYPPTFLTCLLKLNLDLIDVINSNQSEARKQCFLASDWSKFETLPREYLT